MSTEEIPRRCCLNKLSQAERAIHDAMAAVEAVGADVRLTDAVILLSAAKDSVADYVDNSPEIRRCVQTVQPTSALPSAAPAQEETIKIVQCPRCQYESEDCWLCHGARSVLAVVAEQWHSGALQRGHLIKHSESSRVSSSALAPLVTRWEPITTASKDGRTILVLIETPYKHRRIVRAAFFPAGKLDMEDEYPGEIDEEGKNAEDVWVEDSESHDPGYWVLNGTPLAWAILPDPPTEAELAALLAVPKER